MICKQCNLEKQIQNKTRTLCADCVYKNNHDGKSKQEVYSSKASLKPIKSYVFKRSTPIKQQTKKEGSIKKELSIVKNKIRQDALQNDEYYCKGCGVTGALDCSHILSVGQFKELELDEENINLFCRTCHMNWEANDIEKMGKLLTFRKDLEYIKKHSRERYSKIVHKMQDFTSTTVTGEILLKIFQNILKINEKKVAKKVIPSYL